MGSDIGKRKPRNRRCYSVIDVKYTSIRIRLLESLPIMEIVSKSDFGGSVESAALQSGG